MNCYPRVCVSSLIFFSVAFPRPLHLKPLPSYQMLFSHLTPLQTTTLLVIVNIITAGYILLALNCLNRQPLRVFYYHSVYFLQLQIQLCYLEQQRLLTSFFFLCDFCPYDRSVWMYECICGADILRPAWRGVGAILRQTHANGFEVQRNRGSDKRVRFNYNDNN